MCLPMNYMLVRHNLFAPYVAHFTHLGSDGRSFACGAASATIRAGRLLWRVSNDNIIYPYRMNYWNLWRSIDL